MSFGERQQELVILRIGCLYASDYVWKHHVPVAKEFGASDGEIEAVRMGRFEAFNGLERALLTLKPWWKIAPYLLNFGLNTAVN